jgi:antitoxin YobK
MSRADFDKALKLIAEHEDPSDFVGPRPAELIAKAEKALGHKFPSQFRQFVSRFGAGSFGSFEIYGVIDDEFERSSVPNGVWLNLKGRREYGMPGDLLVIADLGNGDSYCIELEDGAEGRVVLLIHGRPPAEAAREFVAEDFGAFLLEQVEWVLEDDG